MGFWVLGGCTFYSAFAALGHSSAVRPRTHINVSTSDRCHMKRKKTKQIVPVTDRKTLPQHEIGYDKCCSQNSVTDMFKASSHAVSWFVMPWGKPTPTLS